MKLHGESLGRRLVSVAEVMSSLHTFTCTQVVCTVPLATDVIFQTTPVTRGLFSLLSLCTVTLLESPLTECHSATSHLILSPPPFSQQALHRVSHLWVTRAQETRLSRETPEQETKTHRHSQEEEEVGYIQYQDVYQLIMCIWFTHHCRSRHGKTKTKRPKLNL